MSNKDFYMIGYNILTDVEQFDTTRMSAEDLTAVKRARDVLACLYTSECMDDILHGCSDDDAHTLGVFCDAVLERIPVYHNAAEEGLSASLENEGRE